jgi:hypothetical protein
MDKILLDPDPDPPLPARDKKIRGDYILDVYRLNYKVFSGTVIMH